MSSSPHALGWCIYWINSNCVNVRERESCKIIALSVTLATTFVKGLQQFYSGFLLRAEHRAN